MLEKIISMLSKGPTKFTLVVRLDLKMSKGKTAAQCAHASILCYEKLLKVNPSVLKLWLSAGQPKIVLQAKDLTELEDIYRRSKDAGIVAELVADAGRTQLEAGTITVLGLGPDYSENIDKIVKHLKLL